MTRRLLALLSATTFLVAGCGQKTDTDSNTTTTSTSVTNEAMTDTAGNTMGGAMADTAAPAATGAQGFANTAAASDAFEIATSKLAADNGASAATRKFATQMIAAHTESTAKLKGIAAGLSPAITPDPTLDADHQARLDALKAKKGAEFDTAYAAEQVAAHEAALQLLQTYAASGDVPQLKQFAGELAPKVAAHLNMAKSLNR